MNEKNNDQNQKPKISKLATASSACLLVAVGIPALILLLSPDLDKTPVWIEVFVLAGFVTAPVLGILAHIEIHRSKETLIGRSTAWMGIAIPVFVIINFCFFRSPPPLGEIRSQAWKTTCGLNLKVLGTAIPVYVMDNNGHLPPADGWCDLLIREADVNPESIICKGSDAVNGQSSYALNKSIVGLKLDEIPQDVVLLFETTPGWNQVGGKELLTTENHNGKGCNILFAGCYAMYVEKENLDTLRWRPDPAGLVDKK